VSWKRDAWTVARQKPAVRP